MEKVYRDGKTAVLVSPGFGAGWSSWARSNHAAEMAMDADLVNAVLEGNKDKAARIAKEKYDEFTGGADDLVVEWVPIGSQFEIREYDGSETLHVIGEDEYLTA